MISETHGQLGLERQVHPPRRPADFLSPSISHLGKEAARDGSGLPDIPQLSTGSASSAQGFPLHNVISARKGKVWGKGAPHEGQVSPHLLGRGCASG